jgi:hypothetical protein
MESLSVDGRSVTYADLMAQYDYWKSRVAREIGTRQRVLQVDLSGF